MIFLYPHHRFEHANQLLVLGCMYVYPVLSPGLKNVKKYELTYLHILKNKYNQYQSKYPQICNTMILNTYVG